MKRGMDVVWFSNSPTVATGYGVQTAQVTQRLHADQHRVAIACNYGLNGSLQNWNGIPIYPTGVTQHSDDIIYAHYQHWTRNSEQPSVVITLFDVWALQNPLIDRIPKIAAWAPIDHQPTPPDVVKWLRRPNVMPIAMSKFGSRMMELEKIEHLYAPHGIERVFQPTSSIKQADGKRVTGRELMNAPDDAFIVTINSANKGHTPPRKAWGENLLAFSLFAQKHKDAILYIHTDASRAFGGVDIPKLVKAAGIDQDQVRIVDQYLYRMNMPAEALAAIYTASDVLLCTSAGEGFGVPVIEAQACGTRVIVSDFSAQPELVADGWIVNGQPLWDANQNSWFFTPHVANIVEALQSAYNAERGPSQKAIDGMREYDADHVYEEYWRPIMERLALWRP
jgi:glycosyltransferase involved in cell wall biosynthesis